MVAVILLCEDPEVVGRLPSWLEDDAVLLLGLVWGKTRSMSMRALGLKGSGIRKRAGKELEFSKARSKKHKKRTWH